MRRLPIAVASVVAGLAIAQPASAVRVEVTPDALVYTAAPGEINRAGIARAQDPGQLQVLDSSDVFPGVTSARVETVEPCRPLFATFSARARPPVRVLHGAPFVVVCPYRAKVVVSLGDHGDSLAIDTLLRTTDRVDAGPGDDIASAGAGADVLLGGAGRDSLVGGLGPDRLDGGPGADAVRYDVDGRRTGVVATTAGAADDGSAEDGPRRARDRLVAIEHVHGTEHGDVLTGGDGANELIGGEGADRLAAGGGADVLLGGRGRDRLAAGPGDDRLDSRDGSRDRVACDAGDDLVSTDPADRPRADCETVARARDGAFDEPMEIGPRARRTRAGRIVVRLRCPRGSACEGTVAALTPGGRRLGDAFFEIDAGSTAHVAIGVRGTPPPSVRVRASTGEDTRFVLHTQRTVRLNAGAPGQNRA